MFRKNIRKIGIYIGADHIAVSEGVKNSHTSTTFSEKRYTMDGISPGIETLLNNKDVMRQVITDVKNSIGSHYVKVNVAIADPYLICKVFELNHDLKTQGNISDYLLWRFKNEYFIDVENKQLSYQYLSNKEGKCSILAQLCDKRLLSFIVDTFAVNKIAVNTIDSSYSYIHNYLTGIGVPNLSSVFVHLGMSWLSVSLDDDCNPVQMKSGWFESRVDAQSDCLDELKGVFGRVERDTYSEIRNTGSVITALPVLHVIGNANIDYEGIAKSSYSGECRVLGEFVNRSDYADYVNGSGEFCVERIAVSCQR